MLSVSIAQTVASEFSLAQLPVSAVHRHLADQIRRAMQMIPCEPDTPEARAARDGGIIDMAMSLRPETDAEVMCAVNVVVADAQKGALIEELVRFRGDPSWTSRLIAQSNSLGRESRGALGALLKLQVQRLRLSPEALEKADAAARGTGEAMRRARAEMPPLGPALPVAAIADPPRAARSSRWAALPGPALPPEPKITRPPAPLPPSLLHLANRPDPPELSAEGPATPPGYAPWEPGCDTPMWYTMIDDHLTEEQLALRQVWLAANEYCVTCPAEAQAIRRHRGPPPDGNFDLPSPDVLHVLLHDNSANFVWVDNWQPYVAKSEPAGAEKQDIAAARPGGVAA